MNHEKKSSALRRTVVRARSFSPQAFKTLAAALLAGAGISSERISHAVPPFAEGSQTQQQTKSNRIAALDAGEVYYDADEVSVDNNGNTVLLRGRVLFLFGESFIKSDILSYDRRSGIAVAEGSVYILREKERLEATRMVASTATREAWFEDVRLIVDPTLTEQNIDFDVLGISKAEVAFESERKTRQTEIIAELKGIRESYVTRQNLASIWREPEELQSLRTETESLERRYAQLLGRLTRTRFQPNLFLEALDEDQKERLKARRLSAEQFAAANKAQAKRWAAFDKAPGYLALTAESIYQQPTSGQKPPDLVAQKARLTPCRCGRDEIAAWGFSASSANITPSRYATLHGVTVDVADIPVGYLPYLKFPIKSERESGFLLPSIFLSRSGQVISQPYYQTLGEHADTTLTFENYSSRGLRAGVELRVNIAKSARLNLTGEFGEDLKRVSAFDRKSKEAEIEREFSDDPLAAEEYKQNIGEARSERWQTTGALNIPYGNAAALKGIWQIVSDNQYLSDYSVEQESKNDLFASAQSTFRFLNQEAAAEYYGSRFGLSLRIQRLQDVLEVKQAATPFRAPKIEFVLFPWRLLDSHIYLDHSMSWEQWDRDDQKSFLDLYGTTPMTESETVSQPSGSAASIRNLPDGVRTPNEPFVKVQRLTSQFRMNTPLVSNPFLLSTFSLRGFTSAYIFDAEPPFPRQVKRMAYTSAELLNRSQLKLKGEAGLLGAEQNLEVTSLLQPYVDFNMIPSVFRDKGYPDFYDVFSQEDNVAPVQQVNFGLKWDFSLTGSQFKEAPAALQRIEAKKSPEPADLKLLRQASGVAAADAALPRPEVIFRASTTPEFSDVLLGWARLELSAYSQAIKSEEPELDYLWPDPAAYRLQSSWSASPFSLGVGTSYNFDAERTKADTNTRLRRGEVTDRIDPWGDVVFSGAVRGDPLLPANVSTVVHWSPFRKALHKGSTSVQLRFPFNLTLGYSNSFETYSVGAEGNSIDYLKRTIGYTADYTPVKWLRLTMQRKDVTDSALRDLPQPELRYEGLQKLTFLNIQDCLDIELKRFKKISAIERNAEWSIGFNLKFLGQSRNIGNVGESLNRAIQNRQASL